MDTDEKTLTPAGVCLLAAEIMDDPDMGLGMCCAIEQATADLEGDHFTAIWLQRELSKLFNADHAAYDKPYPTDWHYSIYWGNNWGVNAGEPWRDIDEQETRECRVLALLLLAEILS